MAKVDIAGLLTGIGSAPIDPMAGATPFEMQRQLQREFGGTMRKAAGDLFGIETRTPQEQAQAALAQLDPTKPEDREKIIEIVSRIDPSRVPALREQFAIRDEQEKAVAEQKSKEESIRDSLIRIAGAQGNTQMVDFLQSGGPLDAAATILFRQEATPKKATFEGLTKNEREDMTAALTTMIKSKKVSKLPSVLRKPGWFRDGVVDMESPEVRSIFTRAKQIFESSAEGTMTIEEAISMSVMEAEARAQAAGGGDGSSASNTGQDARTGAGRNKGVSRGGLKQASQKPDAFAGTVSSS